MRFGSYFSDPTYAATSTTSLALSGFGYNVGIGGGLLDPRFAVGILPAADPGPEPDGDDETVTAGRPVAESRDQRHRLEQEAGSLAEAADALPAVSSEPP